MPQCPLENNELFGFWVTHLDDPWTLVVSDLCTVRNNVLASGPPNSNDSSSFGTPGRLPAAAQLVCENQTVGILFVAPRLGVASELWLERMLDGLAESVVSVAIFYGPDENSGGPWRYQHIADDKAWFPLRVLRRLGLIQNCPPKRTASDNLFRETLSPDVTSILVHYLTLATDYSEVWRRTSKPIFVHCHGFDITWDLRAEEDPRLRRHPDDYLNSVRSLPSNVTFIVNSSDSLKRLRAIDIPENRILVKYLGVEVPETLQTRTQSSTGIRILFLGRLVDFKAPDLAIQAFEMACSKGLEGEFTLAGDGPLRATCELLRARSQWRDRINILGAVDKETGHRLRMESDIFTAHSCTGSVTRQEEAFGVAFVEAMAAGLPVVTGRSGGLPEIIESGTHGILFNPGNVEEHAQGLLSLTNNPEMRERLGVAAKQRVRESFTLEREIRRLKEILRHD